MSLPHLERVFIDLCLHSTHNPSESLSLSTVTSGGGGRSSIVADPEIGLKVVVIVVIVLGAEIFGLFQ